MVYRTVLLVLVLAIASGCTANTIAQGKCERKTGYMVQVEILGNKIEFGLAARCSEIGEADSSDSEAGTETRGE